MIQILFFIFLTVFVAGVCIVAYNFNKMAKNMTSNVRNLDFNNTFNDMSNRATTHIIGGLVGAAGMLGALVTGIIWIIQAFKG